MSPDCSSPGVQDATDVKLDFRGFCGQLLGQKLSFMPHTAASGAPLPVFQMWITGPGVLIISLTRELRYNSQLIVTVIGAAQLRAQ